MPAETAEMARATLRRSKSLAKARVEKTMRPFHDGRHTSITNAAAAGVHCSITASVTASIAESLPASSSLSPYLAASSCGPS
jgi:hypothetical protein